MPPVSGRQDCDGVRHAQRRHAVEDVAGDARLHGLCLLIPRAQPWAEDSFEPREGVLGPCLLVIAGHLLPSPSTHPADGLDGGIALRERGFRRSCHGGGSNGRNDYARSESRCQDRAVDGSSVVGAVRDEALVPGSPAAVFLDLLETRPKVQSLPVGPLPPADSARLVEELLGLHGTLAAEVVDRAGGNPMFAVQLVGDWVAGLEFKEMAKRIYSTWNLLMRMKMTAILLLYC